MRHFNSQTGGRYTYTDDVINLQELALAINAIFDGCDNFIISGCEISGTTIAPGYVYINGEIRYFSGASGINSWPRYIYEANSTENVAYASGSDKIGRTVYGCSISTSIPSKTDPVTAKVPGYITINQAGGLRIKDAFFGKYAILINSLAASQDINSVLNLNKELNAKKGINVTEGVNILGSNLGRVYQEGDKLVIQYKASNNKTYKIVISDADHFSFMLDNTVLFRIGTETIETNFNVKALSVLGGNIIIDTNHIFNNGENSDRGSLYLNFKGYNGTYNVFRNTYIGDGKGNAILSIFGADKSVTVNGALNLSGNDEFAITLKSNLAYTDATLKKSVIWKDLNNNDLAILGFTSSEDKAFRIKSYISEIIIEAQNYVDIKAPIRENGKLLSEKYLLKSDFQTGTGSFITLSDVYSKQQSDEKYALLTGGITQFIKGINTANTLRTSIGATSLAEVKESCAVLGNYLSDMATSESAKAAIRKNIGAAAAGSYQPKLADTGWLTVISGKLYARQIGNIVSIQGKLTTKHDGTVFTLPNGISAPTYAVNFSSGRYTWAAYIAGGSRECKVSKCANHNESIYFSMTYMV